MQGGRNVSLSTEMNEGPEPCIPHQDQEDRVNGRQPHSNFKLCQSGEFLQNFAGPPNHHSIFFHTCIEFAIVGLNLLLMLSVLIYTLENKRSCNPSGAADSIIFHAVVTLDQPIY